MLANKMLIANLLKRGATSTRQQVNLMPKLFNHSAIAKCALLSSVNSMQMRSFAYMNKPITQAALMKHFSTTKAAVTQMEMEIAKDSLKSQSTPERTYR